MGVRVSWLTPPTAPTRTPIMRGVTCGLMGDCGWVDDGGAGGVLVGAGPPSADPTVIGDMGGLMIAPSGTYWTPHHPVPLMGVQVGVHVAV